MSEIKWAELRTTREVATADESLSIVVDKTDPIPVGAVTLQLVVIDNSGNKSQPAQVKLIIRDTTAPTAVLTAVDVNGRPLRDNVLEAGAGFILSGKGSIDLPPGKIEKFVWTLVQ